MIQGDTWSANENLVILSKCRKFTNYFPRSSPSMLSTNIGRWTWRYTPIGKGFQSLGTSRGGLTDSPNWDSLFEYPARLGFRSLRSIESSLVGKAPFIKLINTHNQLMEDPLNVRISWYAESNMRGTLPNTLSIATIGKYLKKKDRENTAEWISGIA